MSTKGIVVITLVAALGLLFASGAITASPTATATTTSPQDSVTSASNQSSTTSSNATQFEVNQTTSPSPSPEEQRIALVRSFIGNLTSGDAKVIVITHSNQPGVPAQQQPRDIDPLGLVNFTGDEATMQITQPENTTTALGGMSDSALTLYAGGQMTFMYENLTIEPPIDIDVLLISKTGDELRFPTAIDNAGLDAEFVIPEGVEDGKEYLVLLAISWPDLQQDILMGIDGRAVANTQ